LRSAFSDSIRLGTLEAFLSGLRAGELQRLHYDFELWARDDQLPPANRSFWRQTILPLVTRTAKAISGWLGPAFDEGAGLELRPDLDAIEALSTEREALWERVRVADFLTINEKRAAVGYEPVEGGDELAAPVQQ
jgi:phage portal protein BeeE